MSNITKPTDGEAIVKMATCTKCNGWVTIAIKQTMTLKDRNLMAREAMEYNHSISELPLLEWRKLERHHCNCK